MSGDTVSTETAPGPVAPGRGLPVGPLVFAGGIVALGVFALVQARSIAQPITAGTLGPRMLPYLIGTALVLSGLAAAVAVLRGNVGEAEQGEDIDPNAHTDWGTVAWLIGLIAAHVFLILPLGWPLAAAILFTGCAWVFGAKPRWRAAAIGIVMALVLQAAFAGGLGVSLPAGPLLEGVPFLHG